ncbi:MAG: hypothetical protein IJ737_06915 [Ruminococcus sp.]|nr:hypothetical protein [Ruminococcus sp.]
MEVLEINHELTRPLTDYAIAVKVALMKQNKTQTWLIERLRERLPERYIDSSIIYKVFTGQVNSQSIIEAINEILGI